MQLYENYVPLERRVPAPSDIFVKTIREFHSQKEPGKVDRIIIESTIVNHNGILF